MYKYHGQDDMNSSALKKVYRVDTKVDLLSHRMHSFQHPHQV